MNADQLQALLYREIPLSVAMQLQVHSVSPEQLSLYAPLLPNRNLHGTAFAGSLYSLATLAGWSLLTVHVAERQWSGSVVLRHADIRYQRPVEGDLTATALFADGDSVLALAHELERRQRGRIVIPVTIAHDGKLAVSFNGEFVFHRHT